MIQGILSLATIADNNPILLDEALETATAPRCGTILDLVDESHMAIHKMYLG